MFNALVWLQNWYLKNCDGEWEHGYGVALNTLDNPGWMLKINLQGTKEENLTCDRFQYQNVSQEDDWIHYWIKDKTFHGACGPLNLVDLIQKFKELIEKK